MTLKIEAGKEYRTRSGEKVFILGVLQSPEGKELEYPVLGVRDGEDPESNQDCWKLDGRWNPDAGHSLDIVAEYKQHTVRVYVYYNTFALQYSILGAPAPCPPEHFKYLGMRTLVFNE